MVPPIWTAHRCTNPELTLQTNPESLTVGRNEGMDLESIRMRKMKQQRVLEIWLTEREIDGEPCNISQAKNWTILAQAGFLEDHGSKSY